MRIESQNNFERDLVSKKTLPACRRLALYICKIQLEEMPNDMAKAKPWTREEVAVLYDIFLKHFASLLRPKKDGKKPMFESEESIVFSWSVDYHADYQLGPLLREWCLEIEKRRKGSPIPFHFGHCNLDYKCTYCVQDGCAYLNTWIIGLHGDVLDEDPWITFFEDEKPESYALAKKVRPKRSFEMDCKFFNRDICRKMGFTLDDAILLAETENLGVLSHVIRYPGGKHLSRNAQFKLLAILSHHMNWELIELCLKKGMKVFDTGADYFCRAPLDIMLEKLQSHELRFLTTKYKDSFPFNLREDQRKCILHILKGAAYIRLQGLKSCGENTGRAFEIMNSLLRVWFLVNREKAKGKSVYYRTIWTFLRSFKTDSKKILLKTFLEAIRDRLPELEMPEYL